MPTLLAERSTVPEADDRNMVHDSSQSPSVREQGWQQLVLGRGARVGLEDLPAAARDRVPRSLALNAASGGCSKFAEQLASPGVVLTLLLSALGAPIALAGVVEPLRNGLSTLPQLALAPAVRAVPRRSRVWAGAAFGQALALAALVVAAATTSGLVAGALVLVILGVFSVLSGAASAVFSDVVGVTVPRGLRGRLLGLRTSLGGLAGLVVGTGLAGTLAGQDRTVYLGLVAGAALLWIASAALFARIPDPPNPTDRGESPLATAVRGLAGLREPWFARFTAARVLLVAVELALPYFTLAARHSGAAATVGLLLVASGLAELVGGPAWGRLTDRVSPRASFLAAAAIVLLAVAVTAAGRSSGTATIAPYAVALFLATLARGGVRTARKAYIINTAPAHARSLYTATSNSLTGIAMLAFAAVGLLAGSAGASAALYLVAGCAVAGGTLAATLPTTVVADR